MKDVGSTINYFLASDNAFSIIPEARTTPKETIKIPTVFKIVIVSPKKTKPPELRIELNGSIPFKVKR